MEDGLTCCFIDVDAYIVTIWMESFFYLLLYILQDYIHGFSLMIGEVEIVGYMSLGDDECMTWRYWITIIEGYTGGCLTYYLHLS